MQADPSLQPTLWRTCRVIANHARLKMFGLLLQDPGLTVAAIARHLRRPLSMTSEYLRAMEARGLLSARRTGRWVEYRPNPATSRNFISGLVVALREAFQREPEPVETIFRLATAFTHPRRIEIFRALQTEPRTVRQLQAVTRIPGWALRRHLKKLETRGFVRRGGALYAVASCPSALGRELARLAVG